LARHTLVSSLYLIQIHFVLHKPIYTTLKAQTNEHLRTRKKEILDELKLLKVCIFVRREYAFTRDARFYFKKNAY